MYVWNFTASAPYFFAILISFLAWINEPLWFADISATKKGVFFNGFLDIKLYFFLLLVLNKMKTKAKDLGINLVESFSEFKEFKNIDRATMMRVLEDVFRNILKKK